MWMVRTKPHAVFAGMLGCALAACVSNAPKPDAPAASATGPVTAANAPAAARVEAPRVTAVEPGVAASAHAAQANDVPKTYRQAIEALRVNQDAEAERLLIAVTDDNPELSGAYINLGIVRYRASRWEDAIAALNKAVSLAPDNAVAYNYLGMSYRGLGRFTEAKEAYRRAMHADPDYAYAYRNLGILYDLYLRDAKQALENYHQYQTLTNGQDKEVAQWVVELERRIQQGEKPKP